MEHISPTMPVGPPAVADSAPAAPPLVAVQAVVPPVVVARGMEEAAAAGTPPAPPATALPETSGAAAAPVAVAPEIEIEEQRLDEIPAQSGQKRAWTKNEPEEGIELRRSGRERRTTTVTYKLPGRAAYQVKVNNQYDLEEGERSVFDSELAGLRGNLIVPDATPQMYFKPKKADLPPPAPRIMGPEEKARLAQNAQLTKLAATLEERRQHWQRCHLAALEPWIPAKEAARLRSEVSVAAPAPPLPRLEQQPAQINGVLKEYQVEGFSFLMHMIQEGLGCILADEMGLGKTLQTISVIAHLKLEMKEPGPCLVVVPLSVLSSWMNEFKRWCPELNVARAHTSDQQHYKALTAQALSVGPDAPDVVLTTYDMVKSMTAITQKLNWRLLVLDEGHLIKNDETARANMLRRVRAVSTVLLTGTPLQNNLRELWALLTFLNPVFSDPAPFEAAFHLGTTGEGHTADESALTKAHALLRLYCLRRTKQQVEVNLPPLFETRVNCPLSKLQTFWYRRLLLRDYKTLLAKVEAEEAPGSPNGPAKPGEDTTPSEANAWRKLQALFIQLRKVCNHPYLFPDAEKHFDGSTGEDLVEVSGKLAVLDRLLHLLHSGGHRVVLFSQFTKMLDIFEDMMILRGYGGKYMRLDGGTNRVQRTVDISEFNRPRPPGEERPFLYMLCTRAGGLGVNLQTADTVILYDSDWNPQVDLQAIARVHRIGQTKPVAALRLVTTGTAEQRVVERAEKKLYLDVMVGRGSTADGAELERKEKEGVSKNDLLGALVFGADRIFSASAGDMPTDAELSTLLDTARHPMQEDAAKPSTIVEAKQKVGEFDPESEYTAKSSIELRAEYLKTLMEEQAATLGHSSSNQDIAKQAAADMQAAAAAEAEATPAVRDRGNRIVEVRDSYGKVHRVLKENMYDLNKGEPSVFEKEARAMVAEKPKSTRQKPGRDYDHSSLCQICWEGKGYWGKGDEGTMVKCAFCPVVAHKKCLEEHMVPPRFGFGDQWTCPHHECINCGIRAAAAGGLLFRCECCDTACCEDHLPVQAQQEHEEGWFPSGNCRRFEALGQDKPKQAYFITCSKDCREWRDQNPKMFCVLSPKKGKGKAKRPAAAKTPPSAAKGQGSGSGSSTPATGGNGRKRTASEASDKSISGNNKRISQLFTVA